MATTTRNGSSLKRLTPADILAALAVNSERLDRVNADRDRLYAERRALFVEGRRRRPPMPTAVLGAAAKVSDVMVTRETRP